MARGNRREIIASALGMDYAEMGEYEYQPGPSPKVYAVGETYVTCGTPAEIAKATRRIGLEFKPHPDLWMQGKAKSHGWVISVAEVQ